jgi:hypothetical protein
MTTLGEISGKRWIMGIKERRNSLLDLKRYRNGISAIPASSIASQFYCELKVELSYKQGDIETEEKTTGTALHEELLAMEKTTLDEMISRIETMPLYACSFQLAAQLGDIVITGIPDVVVFQDGKPTFIIELKTTRGRTDYVYDDQRAQSNRLPKGYRHILSSFLHCPQAFAISSPLILIALLLTQYLC